MILDEVAPEIVIVAPAGGALTNRPESEIVARASDAFPAKVRIGDRDAEPAGDGTWRATVLLAEGENEIPIVGTDRAGNETRPKAVRTLDTRPPKLELTPAESIGSRLWIRGSVDDARPSHVEVDGARVDLAADRSLETKAEPAGAGASVRVQAVDLAGNRSPAATPEHTDAAEVTITGAVDRDGATVAVNGREVPVRDRGFSAAVRSVPALIDALAATEPLVASDANDALRRIAGRDFGWRQDLEAERLAELQRTARAWWDSRPDGPGN